MINADEVREAFNSYRSTLSSYLVQQGWHQDWIPEVGFVYYKETFCVNTEEEAFAIEVNKCSNP